MPQRLKLLRRFQAHFCFKPTQRQLPKAVLLGSFESVREEKLLGKTL